MQLHPFESLRERLLRAGVAPRHVRRYLRELSDHYDDALRAELARGADLAAARANAWDRLGSPEALAQSVLARPELRSAAARFPALVFGLGPVFTWLGVAFALALALHVLPESRGHAKPTAGTVAAIQAAGSFYVRVLPVLLGAAALAVAARRRSSTRWPLAGAALVDVLAGTLVFYSVPGQLGLTSSLLPWLLPFSNAFGPRDPMALGEGLVRAVCMLALSLIVQRFARRFDFSSAPRVLGK